MVISVFPSGEYDVLYKMTVESLTQRLWILCVVLITAAGGEKLEICIKTKKCSNLCSWILQFAQML